ncbi:hypothetical protein N7520_010499 [Penicillium odoratum]|uniref:uncharacterized protein n=1 Tax=Penicillium odoratum TaxID=1167516 RepID=UPI00254803B8|nr:uncharacterized protein N7520_010499 [Penicillium odoratum]KAJ5745317.1 hypothetical protein N7520_010499 [Penicillium odoratum]
MASQKQTATRGGKKKVQQSNQLTNYFHPITTDLVAFKPGCYKGLADRPSDAVLGNLELQPIPEDAEGEEEEAQEGANQSSSSEKVGEIADLGAEASEDTVMGDLEPQPILGEDDEGDKGKAPAK